MNIYEPYKPSATEIAKANAIKASSHPLAILNELASIYDKHIRLIFNSSVPADEIVAAMGASASEVFAWRERLECWMESEQPGSTNIPAKNLLKPYAKNADGTVALIKAPVVAKT